MYLPDWKWIPIRKELLLMSNKVIFNLDDLFISVGIDVGADFSWMSIALPNQQFVGKPYKILHSSIDSLTTAVSKIKEAEELYSLESRIFLESTGIYHYPLFCYLRDKGFNCSVINPIITKNSTNINIRKVHNDRSHLSSVTAYIFFKIFNSLILSNFPLKSCRFSTVPDLKLY